MDLTVQSKHVSPKVIVPTSEADKIKVYNLQLIGMMALLILSKNN